MVLVLVLDSLYALAVPDRELVFEMLLFGRKYWGDIFDENDVEYECCDFGTVKLLDLVGLMLAFIFAYYAPYGWGLSKLKILRIFCSCLAHHS